MAPFNYKALAAVIVISIAIPVSLSLWLGKAPPELPAAPIATMMQPMISVTPTVVTQQVINVVTQIVYQRIVLPPTAAKTKPVVAKVDNTQDLLIKTLQNTIYALTNKPPEPNVEWLASPVTQNWVWDNKKQAWKTDTTYEDSFRSQPSILLGLRDDGVVIWKRLK